MREYGQIQCSFWSDYEIQQWSDDAKLLACYLLTGPHSNGLGSYRIPYGYISDDLGWDSIRVSKGFDELYQNGFCKRCQRTKFVLIYKFLRWNPISNANVAKARVKEFEHVSKKSIIYNDLCNELIIHGTHFDEPFRNHLETLSKQEQEKNLTRKEPESNPETIGSKEPMSTDKSVNGSCPHLEIIKLYGEVLPELRQPIPERWKGSKSATALQARWREDKRHQDLEFWRGFFDTVRQNEFWMGDNARGWKADLRWLVERRNFDKVVEL